MLGLVPPASSTLVIRLKHSRRRRRTSGRRVRRAPRFGGMERQLTRVIRELGVGRGVSALNAEGFADAPLWHIWAPHFETPAVRRASYPAISWATLRRDLMRVLGTARPGRSHSIMGPGDSG